MITIDANPASRRNIDFQQKIYRTYCSYNVKLYSLFIPSYKEEQFILPMPGSLGESSNSLNCAIELLLFSINAASWNEDEFLEASVKGTLSKWDGSTQTNYHDNIFGLIPYDHIFKSDYAIIEYVANGFSFPINPNIITAHGYSFYNLSK